VLSATAALLALLAGCARPDLPPGIPTTPKGLTSLCTGVSYSFSSSATDSCGDSISIRFGWGDGDTSDWSSFVATGDSVEAVHSWSESGTYLVSAQSQNPAGMVSGWSAPLAVACLDEGTVKWTTGLGVVGRQVRVAPAIGADGTIYAGADSFCAVNPDGTLQWSIGVKTSSSPAVDEHGNVYFGSQNYVRSVTRKGELRWSFDTGDWVASSPAIGADGTVYVGVEDGRLFALDPHDGSPNWCYSAGWLLHGSPAIGSDGTIYVGSAYGALYAVGPDGVLEWQYPIPGGTESSVAIDGDGMLFVGSADSGLFSIHSGWGRPLEVRDRRRGPTRACDWCRRRRVRWN